ncbi:MAG: sigma-70 family RNA polymerase sigma factor [Bacteroidales bacterium]|nr:sigma-70 family RNA polymerase sigma factor [Bacteroidales bacterium]
MALRVSWKKYDDLSDEALAEKFRASGDLEVLGVLYERYMHLVYGVCLKYLENREEARDGVTVIFEKLITELPRHQVDHFKSWLHVLTKNFCLMQLRSGKSASRRLAEWQKEQETFMESPEEMHPIDEDKHATNMALLQCIEQLKKEQQQCIRLFYYDSRSYREIAAKLSLEENKVKSHIQNGKRNLKICIEEKNGKKGKIS